jgi:hypothetical protein
MPLQKQNLNINFSQGLDTKTDPWQVQAGKMLELENSVFNKGGLLQKRNGFQQLNSLSNTSSTTLTTFTGNLIAVGTSLNVLSESTNQWYDKGNIQPLDLSVIQCVRTSSSQTTVDISITSNGLACVVYMDSDSNSYYQIVDSTTGQIIVDEVELPSTATMPRVFSFQNQFIITFLITITDTHLQYISIPINMPTNPGSAVDLSTQVSSLSAGYDGYVSNNNLYLAWDGSDIGHAIRIKYLTSTLNQSNTVTINSYQSDLMSVSVDNSQSSDVIWITFWDSSSTNITTSAYSHNLIQILSPTTLVSSVDISTLTSTSQSMVLQTFYDTINTYGYSSTRSDYVSIVSCTQSGTVGTPTIILRSVGLASKSFYFSPNNLIYLLVSYGGAYQPTYFLIDQNANPIAKLAYSNGGGYAINQILPSVNVSGNSIQVGYLYQSLLVPVNKNQGVITPDGIYAQTGINLATFNFNNAQLISSEISKNLFLTGGFLWAYDGAKATEQGFHLWPEDIGFVPNVSGGGLSPQQYYYYVTYEWTDAQGNLNRSAPSVPLLVDLSSETATPVTFKSVFSTGANVLTVSSVSGLYVGQIITDSTTSGNLNPNTTITEINGSTITINQATLGNSASSPGDTLSTSDTLSVTLKVPTLRITYKTGVNVARIVIYRWSVAQQIPYQVTSIGSPILNSTTTDSITYTDSLSDADILGNVILYTEGGVVEDIGAPACSSMTLFKTRLMLVDAEDRNLIWYSKQVIESTPVEMSDLFTIYVAPTISAQGSTGSITALASMDDKLIIFKENAIYYMVGTGPDNTGANNDFTDPYFITSTVGCSNQQSIVFMPQGLMFQSDKGIWLLGRDLSTNYIGAPVEKYNSALVESALNIPATNQVRFTLNNGITLMYDYYYNQWGTFTNVPAISSTIYQGLHTYLNSFGQVFQENPGVYLDGANPVLMSFLTSWFNMNTIQGFQRAYWFFILGNYITPHKINIQISYDYNPYPTQTTLIMPTNYNPNYGSDSLYGGSSPYGGNSSVEQWRVFLQQQKCESIQISFQEIFDSTFGVQAGAGLTLSGINLVIGAKLGYPKVTAAQSTN